MLKLTPELKKILMDSLEESGKSFNLKESQKIICLYYPSKIKDNSGKVICYNLDYKNNRKKAYIEYILYVIMSLLAEFLALLMILGLALLFLIFFGD